MNKLLWAALLGAALLNLGGCVPVIATTGITVGALMAADRRDTAIYILDEENEWKAANRISDAFGKDVHVNVTSFNRMLLLTGEAPDAATRSKVEELVKAMPDVREVRNEIVIGPPSSFAERSNDAYLTAKVKARFVADKRFDSNLVKVVTEANTVFLMGLVKREEGDDAAQVAAQTAGVQKVVKEFEYID
jgi:osmotically-inducible protein OsmY